MENQRIRLTKKMLKDALINLLQQKKISEITTCELCKHAEINRATFYKYYSIPNDVLIEIKNNLITELDNIVLNYQNDSSHLISALNYLKDNQIIFLILVNNIPSKELEESLFYSNAIKKILLDNIDDKYTKNNRDNIYQFICYGSYSIINKWIFNGCIEPSENIANFIHNIANKIIY